MLDLESAIKHCEEKAEEYKKAASRFAYPDKAGTTKESADCLECANEHEQLAEWLKDYKRLLEERPQGEWIPVSERLPEKYGYYLVTTDESHNAVIDIAEYGKFFRKPENEYVLEWNKASRVIAWQPLPEPYKKGGAK